MRAREFDLSYRVGALYRVAADAIGVAPAPAPAVSVLPV